LFQPPSVFNYFSPLYIIPGTSLFGPEYQIHTLSSNITRVNFVDQVVNNQVGTGVSVDLREVIEGAAGKALEDLTTDEMINVVESILLHESLSQAERDIIRTALENPGNNATARAEAAVYLIATSGRYQVQH